MRHGKINREQAIAVAGIEAVEKVESENCDFTNRVDSVLDLEGVIEFTASVRFFDKDGYERTLTMYYYPDAAQVTDCDGDLGRVDWDCVNGYEID
jgi:hypothetical protein